MSDFQIRTGGDPALFAASSALRRRVFILEQGVPEDEVFDGADEGAVHAVVFDAGEPVAAARSVQNGASWQIGWVAVDPSRRGAGLGRIVMEAAMKAAAERGGGEILLTAQQHATGFYEKLGFTQCGEAETLESGFVLVPMKRTIR